MRFVLNDPSLPGGQITVYHPPARGSKTCTGCNLKTISGNKPLCLECQTMADALAEIEARNAA